MVNTIGALQFAANLGLVLDAIRYRLRLLRVDLAVHGWQPPCLHGLRKRRERFWKGEYDRADIDHPGAMALVYARTHGSNTGPNRAVGVLTATSAF